VDGAVVDTELVSAQQSANEPKPMGHNHVPLARQQYAIAPDKQGKDDNNERSKL